MDPRKQTTDRGQHLHRERGVPAAPAVGGGKKIAHRLGCGKFGPAREGSAEATAALRATLRPASPAPNLVAGELAVGGQG